MRTCRSVELFARLLPIRAWKGDILERHIERCPVCRAKLAVRAEARSFVIEPESVSLSDLAWPAMEAAIRQAPPEPVRRRVPAKIFWRLTAGVAATASVVFLVVLVSPPTRPKSPILPRASIEEFRLDSVEAMGRPARALIFQPRDSGITLIWVE